MKESEFIKQNKLKWREFEEILSKGHIPPHELNRLLIQITDDLSYAQTFYPNRSVRVYLNNLAQQIYFAIYQNKKKKKNWFWSFWSEELPLLIYQSRKEFKLSFFVFFAALFIGMLSSYMDSNFPTIILGEDYIAQTVENIESGDPMAIYKDKSHYGMFIGITFNNVYVAFLTFVMGIFFGIGSLGILVSNGVMVGSFLYFFIERNLFVESFLTVWIHGTLEISAIIIAGAAGLALGKGLAFPGTLSRMQAFQRSARRGLMLMVSITPVLIVAGFLESYLTRHTEAPNMLRLFFILSCLASVLFYYWWYPARKAKTADISNINLRSMPPEQSINIDYQAIKSSGNIFSEIFILFNKMPGNYILLGLGMAMFYCCSLVIFRTVPLSETFYFSYVFFGTIGELGQFFHAEHFPFLPLINTLIFSLITFFCLMFLFREKVQSSTPSSFWLKGGISILFSVLSVMILFYFANAFWTIFVILPFVIPILLLTLHETFSAQTSFFASMSQCWNMLSNNFSKLIKLSGMLLLFSFIILQLLGSNAIWFFADFLSWNITPLFSEPGEALLLTYGFLTVSIIYIIYMLFVLGMYLLHASLKETYAAQGAMDRIEELGKSKRIRGLLKE